jgi:hypothetical protein
MFKTIALAVVITVCLASVASAEEAKTKHASKATTSTETVTTASHKAAPAVKDVNNANCPVSGHEVGSMQEGANVVYKGYRIGLCCDNCQKEFNKDADAFLKKALEGPKKK